MPGRDSAYSLTPSQLQQALDVLARARETFQLKPSSQRLYRFLRLAVHANSSRSCQIFWIAVGPSTVNDSIIARYQAANDPKRPLNTLPQPEQEQVFVEIFERMKRAIKAS